MSSAAAVAIRLASLEKSIGELVRGVGRLTLQLSADRLRPSMPRSPPPSPPPPSPPLTPPPPLTPLTPPPPPLTLSTSPICPPAPRKAGRGEGKGRALVFFDLETTGLGKTANIRIREIGAIELSAVSASLGFREAVNPCVPVQPQALAVAPVIDDAETADTWQYVGQRFRAWMDDCYPGGVVLAGFNSKRYDSRIFCFEQQRWGHRCSRDLEFVDMMEVFRHFFPEVGKPRRLENYHKHVFDGLSIPSAHTALGDAMALRDIAATLDKDKLWAEVEKHKETLDGVCKRCGIDVY